MMWSDSQIFVILANFPKKSLGTILEKIGKLYSRDLLCGNSFEMTWHDGIEKFDQGSLGLLP